METYYPQGQIALPLEQKARDILNTPNSSSNNNEVFYSASQIWAGNFVEVMLFLLRTQCGFEINLRDFADECQPWLGSSLKDIPQEIANTLYNKFNILMDQ